MKRELVRAANRFAKYGLALMLTGAAMTLFVGGWYVAPMISLAICRRRGVGSEER
jgi:hypothetical protein